MVEAFDSVGSSATSSSVMTIEIQADAANLGTYDNLGGLLGSYSSPSWPGNYLLLSTGIDKSNINTTRNQLGNCNFTHNVTFTHADPTRPGGICNIFLSSCANVIVTNIAFTGNLGNGLNSPWYDSVVELSGSVNMTVVNVTATFNGQTGGGGCVVLISGCINCAVLDVTAFGVSSGICDNAETNNVNIQITRFRMREFNNNAYFIGNSINMTITDCVTLAAMRESTIHIDNFQVADGASPQNLKVIRHQMYIAEGDSGAAQGFFGGTAGIYYGFIDDGSKYPNPSGVAGKVLSITNTFVPKALTPWTRLVGTNFNMVQVISVPGGGVLVGKYQLNIPTNMVAASGNISTAPFTNLVINGWAYAGGAGNAMTFRGIAGTSVMNAWTNTRVDPPFSEAKYSVFMATVVGTLMNVTEYISGFALGVPDTMYWMNGSNVVVAGANVGISNWGTAPNTFILSAPLNFPTPYQFKASPDYPEPWGPSMGFAITNTSKMYTGTTTVENGFMWSSYPHGQPGFSPYQPTSINIDTSTTLFGVGNYNFTASCFLHGEPNTYLNSFTEDEWAQMTFDEAIAINVGALTPKVGGPLASGATDIGAFTRDGLWNDGSGLMPYNAANVRKRYLR